MTARASPAAFDFPDAGLAEFVLENAEALGPHTALVDGPTGRKLGYGALAEAVRLTARGLRERGLAPGDVFAISCPNLIEYAVAFHGVLRAGGVVAPANPLATAPELASQLRCVGARFLLSTGPFAETALEAAAATGIDEVFLMEGVLDGTTPLAALARPGGPRAAPVPAEGVAIGHDRRDLAVLAYSSGTTGLPKAVMLTHSNLVANLCQLAPVHHLDRTDVVAGVLPFFHIYGMTMVMNLALRAGAAVVTMPRFDLNRFLDLVEVYRITRACLVPPIVSALARHGALGAHDLSSLQLINCGAAPLSPAVAEACAERLDCAVIQGYGLTETSPVTHQTPDAPGLNRPGSVGPPLPGTECRVVDPDTGEILGPGRTGEVWIRGPQVMAGYLDDPDATAFALSPEGWLRTGDLGRVDGDGYLWIVDRLKELIKFKGLQVAPAELEAVLANHPAVADAAVIPSPDDDAGEVPKALVALETGETEADVDMAEELMAFVAERVAPHKRVRRVEFLAAIPRSASGKILRRVLVERERDLCRSGGENASYEAGAVKIPAAASETECSLTNRRAEGATQTSISIRAETAPGTVITTRVTRAGTAEPATVTGSARSTSMTA